jgi:hypothetical protein
MKDFGGVFIRPNSKSDIPENDTKLLNLKKFCNKKHNVPYFTLYFGIKKINVYIILMVHTSVTDLHFVNLFSELCSRMT